MNNNSTNNIIIPDVKYVVRRDRHRVSENEYLTHSEALSEYNFWKSIVEKIKDGTVVTIDTIRT